jgi:hypothetical protein
MEVNETLLLRERYVAELERLGLYDEKVRQVLKDPALCDALIEKWRIAEAHYRGILLMDIGVELNSPRHPRPMPAPAAIKRPRNADDAPAVLPPPQRRMLTRASPEMFSPAPGALEILQQGLILPSPLSLPGMDGRSSPELLESVPLPRQALENWDASSTAESMDGIPSSVRSSSP